MTGDGLVDLRSDTVTRPTPGMRAAMAAAEVGDDVYGEDPTVARLERRVADLLGHEAALFTPTGSMANQLGVRLLVEPGTELLCEADAHVVRAELGQHAVLGGVTTRTWQHPAGAVDLAALLGLLQPDAGPHFVSTAAVSVENTHNLAGGRVQPLESLVRLRDLSSAVGVRRHLDGARLWNAHVATGVPLAAYGGLFDTVCVCLSKGLGAPVGSLVASSAERIAQARVWRKRLGGGMRQVGVLAAAGLWALDHHLDRLADDHDRARSLAEAVGVDPATVDTNIVVVDVPDAPAVVVACRVDGVLISALGRTRIRLVTHLDVDGPACARARTVLAAALRSSPRPGRPR